MRPIVRIGFSKAEQATPVAAAQCRKQIVKANANESRSLNQVHNRTDALADGRVGFGKRLVNACVRPDHVAHLIVFKANHCVGNLVETTQSFASLGVATPAFERKWQRGKRKHQRPRLAGEMCDIRCRTRTRAAAESRANEDHSCTGQRLANLFCRFESGLIANFGVATCAQTAGDRAAELHFVRSNGTCQRLHVGVNRQDLGSLQSVEHDPVERVETGAANTDNFDWNRVLAPLGEAVVFAKLNHIDLSISSSSSTENSSKDSPKSSRRPVCLHGLGIFDQPDCSRKLRILNGSRYT